MRRAGEYGWGVAKAICHQGVKADLGVVRLEMGRASQLAGRNRLLFKVGTAQKFVFCPKLSQECRSSQRLFPRDSQARCGRPVKPGSKTKWRGRRLIGDGPAVAL